VVPGLMQPTDHAVLEVFHTERDGPHMLVLLSQMKRPPPGRRVMGIFGFCDVRNFTAATECLQEDIMIYINCIAGGARTTRAPALP
jgi:hypothetical protein